MVTAIIQRERQRQRKRERHRERSIPFSITKLAWFQKVRSIKEEEVESMCIASQII